MLHSNIALHLPNKKIFCSHITITFNFFTFFCHKKMYIIMNIFLHSNNTPYILFVNKSLTKVALFTVAKCLVAVNIVTKKNKILHFVF